ncbi:MAG: hypothetical protein O8C55_09605 [Candidatus Methanoperedens sp.]|nr:hypothetical protein [Candidatus Methanoperedens sp.]
MTQIKPHGGNLINRVLTEQKKKKIIEGASEYQSVPISSDLMKDVENIASGLFSPLEVKTMRAFSTIRDFQTAFPGRSLLCLTQITWI